MKLKENLIYDRESTWFISDTHFGHKNVLKFEEGYHEFSSINDHDQEIIANWYSVVHDNDTVFFLGDFSMPRIKLNYVKSIMSQLPGKIVWLWGNHDYHIADSYNWQEELKSVANIIEFTSYKEIFITCTEVTNFPYKHEYVRQVNLFHYPIIEFNGSFKDHYHFYGHTHENLYGIKNAYSVAACLHDYIPVNFDTMNKKIKDFNERLDRPGQPSIQRIKGETWRDRRI